MSSIALITEREDGWFCGTGCLRVSLGNKILDPNYLYYFLGQESVIAWIANQAVGATMPNLNTGILRSVSVRYPSIKAQARIASILSAYDDLIENNTRRIKILEQMAQMLYREWFVNFRFPGHEKFKVVETPYGKIPDGWRVLTLSELCSKVIDGTHDTPLRFHKAILS
jgi:type I restriction enzyme S subunit